MHPNKDLRGEMKEAKQAGERMEVFEQKQDRKHKGLIMSPQNPRPNQ